MSDRAPYDHGDEPLPEPSRPIDPDDVWRPTRPSVYPDDPGFAGFRQPEPTVVVPAVGGLYGEPDHGPPPPWYRQPGAVGALVAGGFAVLLALIAMVAGGDGDGDSSLIDRTPTSTSADPSTTSTTSTTTTVPAVPAPLVPAVPSSAATTTTLVVTASSTTSTATTPSTTTSTTTTTTPAPTTTVASATTASSSTTTTASSTTTARPTTTSEPSTTAPRPSTTAPRPTTTRATTTTSRATTTTSVDGSTSSTAPRPTTTTTPRGTTTTSSIPRQATAWILIVRSPDLQELAHYIRVADMIEVFERRDITVLAPIDQAFIDLQANPGGQELLEDPARVAALLERHVIDERLNEEELFERTELTTIGGDVLAVDVEHRTIDGGQVVGADQPTGNGSILHVFDPVLVGALIPS